MNVSGWESAKPRRSISPCPDQRASAGKNVLQVPTPEANTHKPARVIVRIDRPVIAEKVVHINCAIEPVREGPAAQVNRAETRAVHLLVIEQATDEIGEALFQWDPYVGVGLIYSLTSARCSMSIKQRGLAALRNFNVQLVLELEKKAQEEAEEQQAMIDLHFQRMQRGPFGG